MSRRPEKRFTANQAEKFILNYDEEFDEEFLNNVASRIGAFVESPKTPPKRCDARSDMMETPRRCTQGLKFLIKKCSCLALKPKYF